MSAHVSFTISEYKTSHKVPSRPQVSLGDWGPGTACLGRMTSLHIMLADNNMMLSSSCHFYMKDGTWDRQPSIAMTAAG